MPRRNRGRAAKVRRHLERREPPRGELPPIIHPIEGGQRGIFIASLRPQRTPSSASVQW